MDKVFTFNYCDCIHESSFAIISIHKTKKGAELAMEFHKSEKIKEFNDLYDEATQKKYGFTFGSMEAWDVGELEIQD